MKGPLFILRFTQIRAHRCEQLCHSAHYYQRTPVSEAQLSKHMNSDPKIVSVFFFFHYLLLYEIFCFFSFLSFFFLYLKPQYVLLITKSHKEYGTPVFTYRQTGAPALYPREVQAALAALGLRGYRSQLLPRGIKNRCTCATQLALTCKLTVSSELSCLNSEILLLRNKSQIPQVWRTFFQRAHDDFER